MPSSGVKAHCPRSSACENATKRLLKKCCCRGRNSDPAKNGFWLQSVTKPSRLEKQKDREIDREREREREGEWEQSDRGQTDALPAFCKSAGDPKKPGQKIRQWRVSQSGKRHAPELFRRSDFCFFAGGGGGEEEEKEGGVGEEDSSVGMNHAKIALLLENERETSRKKKKLFSSR